jgi:hypothetical protein
MRSATELLAIENSREAGVVGGVSGLLAALVVTTALGPGLIPQSLGIGLLTGVLFMLFLLGLNAYPA